MKKAVQVVEVAYTPPKFFRVMTRYREAINSMTDSEAGEVFKALLALADTGNYEVPKGDRAKLAVEFIRPDLVADIERARKRSEAGRANVNHRWGK